MIMYAMSKSQNGLALANVTFGAKIYANEKFEGS